jgi:hypothetical protein
MTVGHRKTKGVLYKERHGVEGKVGIVLKREGHELRALLTKLAQSKLLPQSVLTKEKTRAEGSFRP